MLFRALACSVLAFALAACATSSAPQPVFRPHTTLEWGIVGISDIPTLDPALASDPASISVASLVFGGLVRLDAHLRVLPDGATHWRISRNGLAYTFTIRPNLRFADGREVTAQDFSDALHRSLGPENSAGTGSVYLDSIEHGGPGGPIPGIKVIDRSTLRLTLSKPSSHFLAELAFPASFVPDPALFSRYGQAWTNHAAGFGPYLVQTWRHSRTLTLAPNPYYYGGKPTFRRITIHFVGVDAASSAYKRGTLDLVSGLPAGETFPSPPAGIRAVAGLDQDYLAFNTRRLPFHKLNVRRAFAASWAPGMAIARTPGSVLPARGLLPSAFGIKTDRWVATSSGLAYLKRTSYRRPGSFPAVTLIMPHDPHVHALALELQAAWQRDLGISVGLRELNPSLYGSVLEAHQFDVAIVRWGGDYPDPQNYLGTQLGASPVNVTGWSRSAYNDAVLLADSYHPADPRRVALFQRAASLAVEKVPLLPLDEPALVGLIRPGLKGVYLTPLGTIIGQWHTAQLLR